MQYKHGVNIKRGKVSPPSVQTVDASTICVVGTAPGAEVTGKFGDGTNILYDTPFLLTKRSDAPSGVLTDDSQSNPLPEGTLPRALDAIYAQGNSKVVMIIVENISTIAQSDLSVSTYSATSVQGTLDTETGPLWALIENGDLRYFALEDAITADTTALSSLKAGAEIKIYDGSTLVQTYHVQSDYDSTLERIRVQDRAPRTGLTNSSTYTVKIELDGVSATRTKMIGDSDDLTGIYAALAAESELGVKPRILCVPAMDGNGTPLTGSRPVDPTNPSNNVANPLAAAMVIVANRLRAMAIIDGPNTNHADVIEFIRDFTSTRAIVIDPAAKVSVDGVIREEAMSGFVAGVISRNDYINGWWTSFSNKPIYGVLGLGRPIDSGDVNSRAQLMLDNDIWTIVNDAGGFLLWGETTPASPNDEAYNFPNVQRTEDILADSLEQGHRWAVAEGITKNYLTSVEQSVNDFIRTLVQKEALSGGICYADEGLNTPANIAKGEAYFNLEYAPTYPANKVVITIQLNTKHLAGINS